LILNDSKGRNAVRYPRREIFADLQKLMKVAGIDGPLPMIASPSAFVLAGFFRLWG
jgi:hypothetical protein